MMEGVSLDSQHFIETRWIESDHDLIAHDDGRRGSALVFAGQFPDCLTVLGNIFFDERYTPLREVRLGPGAGRSTRLHEYNDRLFGHGGSRDKDVRIQAYSISDLMETDFCNIWDTEQYFSLDSRTASSIAFRSTSPPTV